MPLGRKSWHVPELGKILSQTVGELEAEAIEVVGDSGIGHLSYPTLECCDIRVYQCLWVAEELVEVYDIRRVIINRPYRVKFSFHLMVVFDTSSTIGRCVGIHHGNHFPLE